MSHQGSISVVLSVRNGMPFLPEAIQSLEVQSRPAEEILIIDDGSTDGTPNYLQSLREDSIRVIRQETSSGLAKALNLGIQEAKGDYVARMDADDICALERFALQANLLDENPGLTLTGSFIQSIDISGSSLGGITKAPLNTAEMQLQGIFSVPAFHPAVMLRREALLQFAPEPYDPLVTAGQDYDLWSRLLQEHEGRTVPLPLLKYRKHDKAVSVLRREEQQEAHFSSAHRFLNLVLRRIGLFESDLQTTHLAKVILGHETDESVDRSGALGTVWKILHHWRLLHPESVRAEMVSELAGRIVRTNERQGFHVPFSCSLMRISPKVAIVRLRDRVLRRTGTT